MEIITGQITEHFNINEFACGDIIYFDADAIRFITRVCEPFRVWYNRPININSGYRTPKKNREVGGDVNSLHLWTRAIDFNLPADEWPKMSRARQALFLANVRNKWFLLCRAAGGFGQMTIHNGWLHLGMSLNREYYDDRRG